MFEFGSVCCSQASTACVCCDKWFAEIISWAGLRCCPLLQSNSFGFCVWMLLRSIVKSAWVLAACWLTLHSLERRLLTLKSHSVQSELYICSCVLSAAAADYNTTIPEGLYLWSTWEHCHPLWGQRKTSSKVRPSFCCTFMRKLIRLCSVPTLKAGLKIAFFSYNILMVRVNLCLSFFGSGHCIFFLCEAIYICVGNFIRSLVEVWIAIATVVLEKSQLPSELDTEQIGHQNLPSRCKLKDSVLSDLIWKCRLQLWHTKEDDCWFYCCCLILVFLGREMGPTLTLKKTPKSWWSPVRELWSLTLAEKRPRLTRGRTSAQRKMTTAPQSPTKLSSGSPVRPLEKKKKKKSNLFCTHDA